MLMDSPTPDPSEDEVVMAADHTHTTSLRPAQELVGGGTHRVQLMKACFQDDLNQTYSIASPRLHPPLAQSSRPGSRLEERVLSGVHPSPSPALSLSLLHQSSLLPTGGNTSLLSPAMAPRFPPRSSRERAPPISESLDPFSKFHPPPSSEPLDPFSQFHPPPSSTSSRRPRPAPPTAVTSLQAQSAILVAKRDLQVLVPAEEGSEHSLGDHALFLGRSFRVGWGPNWTLAHSGRQISPSSKSLPAKDAGWTGGMLLDPSSSQRSGDHTIGVNLEQVSVCPTPGICDSVS